MKYHSDRSRWYSRHNGKMNCSGLTYLGLLILLAILGIVSVAAIKVGVAIHRRQTEEALLDVGREFSMALESYRRATPSGQPDQPATMQDLLRDPRFPGIVRHLRKVYADPVTGQQEWGFLRSEDSQRIAGIYSLSNSSPIKIANFGPRLQDFTGKTTYRDWVFTSSQADNHGESYAGAENVSPLSLMDTNQADTSANSASDSQISVYGYIRPIDLKDGP